jgi:hypothetical protein
VRRTLLYDPRSGGVALRAPAGIIAIAGTRVLLAGPGRSFTLVDTRTRQRKRLRWPSELQGADAPATDPRGRFVALGFADPSRGDGKQALDVWLLDTLRGDLTRVPGMPALVELKRTSMSWTDDGRLVLLARSAGRDLVGVFRPGHRRLAVRPVRLRPRGASDSFAILR